MNQPRIGTVVHYRADDAHTGSHPHTYDDIGNTSRCQAAIVTHHEDNGEAIALQVASDHGWQEHRYVYPNTSNADPFDHGRWHGADDHNRRPQ